MSSSVVEVTSLADNGWYRAGQTLPLRVIFTKQATVTLTDGVYSVIARQTDQAGNQGPNTSSIALTIALGNRSKRPKPSGVTRGLQGGKLVELVLIRVRH